MRPAKLKGFYCETCKQYLTHPKQLRGHHGHILYKAIPGTPRLGTRESRERKHDTI